MLYDIINLPVGHLSDKLSVQHAVDMSGSEEIEEGEENGEDRSCNPMLESFASMHCSPHSLDAAHNESDGRRQSPIQITQLPSSSSTGRNSDVSDPTPELLRALSGKLDTVLGEVRTLRNELKGAKDTNEAIYVQLQRVQTAMDRSVVESKIKAAHSNRKQHNN